MTMNDIPKPDLSGQSLIGLHTMLTEAKAEVDSAKEWAAVIQAEIDKRLAPSVLAALEQQGKAFGSVTLACQGGVVCKGTVEKKVEWDSEKLFNLATVMPVDRARAIFKFAVSVPERIYDGVKATDPELGMAIDEARTTKPGAPKITLLVEGA
jgi:hypothetical protein